MEQFYQLSMIGYIGFTAIIVITLVTYYFKHKKRSKEMESLSYTIGCTYTEKNDEIPSLLANTKLLREGNMRGALNVLEKTARNYKVILWDDHYSVMLGRHSKQFRQTIICYLSQKDLGLPRFTIQSKTFFLKNMDYTRHKKINFDTNPEFSKRFYLKGKDKAAIRSIFNTDILSAFETIQDKKMCIESTWKMLVFFKPNKLIQVQDIPMELEKTEKIYNMFAKANISTP